MERTSELVRDLAYYLMVGLVFALAFAALMFVALYTLYWLLLLRVFSESDFLTVYLPCLMALVAAAWLWKRA